MPGVSKMGKAAKPTYSAAIYARLSVEKDERKAESIETQIAIAKAFMETRPELVLYDCYTDLGKTGTNFRRAGFARMMQDVRLGKVNCVIVKDLSRFGRNHIETGNYLEKIFPFLGVRFIAVTDGFDSLYEEKDNAMGVHLKNLINEMYARDIAAKVRAGKRVRREQGSYIGGILPYGYRGVWEEGRKRLVIDESPAAIVKKIYEFFLSGQNLQEIKSWLYEQKVHRPLDYRKTGHVYWREGDILQEWPKTTLKGILKNPVYTGHFIGNSDGGQKVPSIQENTHAAIISRAQFLQAMEKLTRASQKYGRKKTEKKTASIEEDIFEGQIFCGICNVRMSGNVCPHTGRLDWKKCRTAPISRRTLEGLVQIVLRQVFALSSTRLEDFHAKILQEEKALSQKISRLDGKIENIRREDSQTYAKYRAGALDREQFLQEREETKARTILLQRQRTETAEFLKSLEEMRPEGERLWRALAWGGERTALTKAMCRALLHRIEIYPDKRVKVLLAFGDARIKKEGKRDEGLSDRPISAPF